MALSLSICLICACTYVPYWLTYLLLWIIQLFFFYNNASFKYLLTYINMYLFLNFPQYNFFIWKIMRLELSLFLLVWSIHFWELSLEFYVCNLWTGYLFCVHRKKEYFKITFVLGYKHQINIVLYFFASDCKRYNFHFLQNICTIVHWKKNEWTNACNGSCLMVLFKRVMHPVSLQIIRFP